jgi:Cd2+/Zn2+-exporting ATPase
MAEPETTLQIELPVLLPQVADERDQCVARLEERVRSSRGIQRAHVARRDGQAFLCIHYVPNQVSLRQVQRLAEQSGAAIADRFRHETLRILGLDCAACSASLEHILARLEGMLSVSVSYAAERIQLEYDTDRLTHAQILKRISWMGYQVEQRPVRSWLQEHAELVRSLLAGLLLALGLVTEQLPLPAAAAQALYAAAMLAGGFDAARHGLAAAWHRRFDVDLLMALAAAGAAAVGRWAEGAFLLFLFSLGHSLERHAMQRARSAIQTLGELSPRTARVRREGQERELPVEQLLRGDTVIVRPGDRIPADGVLLAGRSAVDQSPVTGESLPVELGPGDSVFAGTLNGAGALEVEVTRLDRDTTLARILTLVREAQAHKSPSQQTAERFTRRFVPLVLAVTAAAILVPPLLGWLSWQQSLLRGMTILVASSPCALAIATPSAVLSAVAQAARNGVLIKGGAHLENLGRIRAMAFDKTGTLTSGLPEITDLVPLDGSSAEELLRVAASAERRSAHPLALAVLDLAAQRGIEPSSADQVTAVAGSGLRASVNGQSVEIGNPSLFATGLGQIPPELVRESERLEQEGKSVILVRRSGAFLGLLGAADQPRPSAAAALAALKAQGVDALVMLTGDNDRVAAAIAGQVGLSEFRASLLPEEKVAALDQLAARYGGVAMVGDGINDAPALAHSTVGIAMGAGGSQLALETADVALMADDLSKLPFALSLSREARRIIRQNLVISAGVIALLVPAALFGLAGIGPAILLHEGSTLLVVANALRLLSHRTN